MKELVVISGKGGTGKTSVMGALADLASDHVLADCDVDASDLHLLLDPMVQAKHPFSGGKAAKINSELCTQCGRCQELCRFDAVTDAFQVDSLACEGCGVCVWNCPESAIDFKDRQNGEWYQSISGRGTPFIHAALLPGEENSGKLVTLVRQQARKLAESQNKTLILVDGPPGTGCPVIAATGGADLLLVVTEPTLSAIHDMERVLALAQHFNVPAIVAINKYDLNAELTQQIEQHCTNQGIKIAGKIPFHEQFMMAQKNGHSVIHIPDSQLNTIFMEMWQTLFNYLQS